MEIYDDTAKVLINSYEYLKLKELADSNEININARAKNRVAELMKYNTTARLQVNITTNGDSWRSDNDELEVDIYTSSNKADIMPAVGRISQEIKTAINHTLEGNIKGRIARKQLHLLSVISTRLWIALLVSVLTNLLFILSKII